MYAFVKQQGLGNDFVVFDARSRPIELNRAVVRRIADRRFGVGCDQVIVLRAPAPDMADADAYMQIFNADGGEVAACGNATRCVARSLMLEAGRSSAVIVTRAGRLDCRAVGDALVEVDMGPVHTGWAAIPLAEPADTLAVPLGLDGLPDPVAVNVGNPHAVFFVADVDAVPLAVLGPRIETHPMFPERTNVEFATVVGADRVRMRIWERGAGITGASGSGASATAVAAVRRGLTGRRVVVELAAGSLSIDWTDDGHVRMTGPTATSFSGTLDPSVLAGPAPDHVAAQTAATR